MMSNHGHNSKKEKQEKTSSEEPFKDEMGSYNYRMFNLFNRKYKITEAEPPNDVKQAFIMFSEGGPHMRPEQLRRFLAVHQNEVRWKVAEAEKLVEEVINRRHHLTKYARHGLTLDDFFHFLLSDDLNAPILTQVS